MAAATAVAANLCRPHDSQTAKTSTLTRAALLLVALVLLVLSHQPSVSVLHSAPSSPTLFCPLFSGRDSRRLFRAARALSLLRTESGVALPLRRDDNDALVFVDPTLSARNAAPATAYTFAADQSRTWTLPLILSRWRGPVSVSVLLRDESEPDDALDDVLSTWFNATCIGLQHDASLPPLSSSSCVLSFLLQSKQPKFARSQFDIYNGSIPLRFPINLLRNIAIRASCLLGDAACELVLLSDADLIPSANSSAQVTQHFLALEREHPTDALALVLPSFVEYNASFAKFSRAPAAHLPATKKELVQQLRDSFLHHGNHGLFVPFCFHALHRAVDLTQPDAEYTAEHIAHWRSYGPTRHGTFVRSSTAYELRRSSLRSYEAYVVVRRKRTPMFPVCFFNRMRNFVVLITHLVALQFRFFVQPSAFLIHHPHRPSIGRVASGERQMNIELSVLLGDVWGRRHLSQHCSAPVPALARHCLREVIDSDALKSFVDRRDRGDVHAVLKNIECPRPAGS